MKYHVIARSDHMILKGKEHILFLVADVASSWPCYSEEVMRN